MEKIGIITEVCGENMTVLISRDSACGDNCAACGLCNNNELTVTLKNTGDFVCGDRVRLISDDKSVLNHSALGYLSLTALIISGGIIGSFLGGDWMSFGCALLGLLSGIVILKLCIRKNIDIKVKKIER